MNRLVVVGLLWASVLGLPAAAEETDRSWSWYADWRARLEGDWDSQNASGVAREDRTRLRARVRVGLRFDPRERIRLEVRLRSGSELSQQSPHVTLIDFDGNDTGSADFTLDRWFVRGKTRSGNLAGWVGRNNLPFKNSHELVWDADATVVGLGGTFQRPFGDHGRLTLQGGRFSAPVGMRSFTGNLSSLQGIFDFNADRGTLTASLGGIAVEAEPGDPDATALLDGNGSRDYATWVVGLSGTLARSHPLSGGIEWMHNSESYSATDPDPVTAANFDQTDGHVVWLRWGEVKKRGDWLLGYAHASIEKLAVNASWAQDDWVRWGSATETRSSGYEGHELRYRHGLGNRQNLTVRLFLVEAIGTIEDGKRLRIDYNGKF